MTKTAIRTASLAALAATAFANAPAAASKGGAPKAEDRIAPVFTAISADVPLPVSKRANGVRSALLVEIEKLEVGQSVGLTNKTKKQISSMISKFSNRPENLRNKVDGDGNPVMKQGEAIKDANGAVIGHGQPTQEKEKIKEFEVHDMDAKKDPAKATVRIFRTK